MFPSLIATLPVDLGVRAHFGYSAGKDLHLTWCDFFCALHPNLNITLATVSHPQEHNASTYSATAVFNLVIQCFSQHHKTHKNYQCYNNHPVYLLSYVTCAGEIRTHVSRSQSAFPSPLGYSASDVSIRSFPPSFTTILSLDTKVNDNIILTIRQSTA